MNEQFTISVTDTNEEALASKISAIRRGYFIDPFAEQFAVFKGNRDILMHRGYWARVHLVRTLAQKFLNTAQDNPVQIISLGCGLETLWFNLMSDQHYMKKNLTFVELDLKNVVKKKVRKIEKSKLITGLIQKLGLWENRTVHGNQSPMVEDNSYLAYGSQYMLASCDLSDVISFKDLLQTLKIDPNKPTFFYCECVLSYINPDAVDQLIKYISDTYLFSWIFDYEMFNPNDRFGKMMVQNFDIRGCPLVGIHKYPNLQDQMKRFEGGGYESTNIELNTMKNIYYDYIDKSQRQKIQKLEMLDEFEEWHIMMNHYFGLLAFNCRREPTAQHEKAMINAMHMKQ